MTRFAGEDPLALDELVHALDKLHKRMRQNQHFFIRPLQFELIAECHFRGRFEIEFTYLTGKLDQG